MSMSLEAAKHKSGLGHYGTLVGGMMQLAALFWFVLIWFSYTTGIYQFAQPKDEVLLPIYILYLLGVIVMILARIAALKELKRHKRPQDMASAFLIPIGSIIVLVLLINMVKFGFT